MARGRFISKEICVDKKVNSLSTPWSMLAYTWLITHADCEGRTYGDPSIIKSMVFPRQDGKITTQQVEEFIQEWVEVGLVNLYEADGDVYLEFPSFEKHQIGLRKDREPSSIIPANIRQTSGKHPAEVKLREEKLSKVEVEGEKASAPAPAPIVVNSFQTGDPFYARIWSKVTGMVAIPGSEIEKVLNALDALRSKYPNEDDLISYLKKYYDDWKARKRKDNGRAYSTTNCAWIYDLAVAGEPVKVDELNKPRARPDPNCPICHGLGLYSRQISDIKDPEFGQLSTCECVKVRNV